MKRKANFRTKIGETIYMAYSALVQDRFFYFVAQLVLIFLLICASSAHAQVEAFLQHDLFTVVTPRIINHRGGEFLFIDPDKGVTFEVSDWEGDRLGERSTILVAYKIKAEYFQPSRRMMLREHIREFHSDSIAEDTKPREFHMPASTFAFGENEDFEDSVIMIYLVSAMSNEQSRTGYYNIRRYVYYPTFDKNEDRPNAFNSVILQFRNSVADPSDPKAIERLNSVYLANLSFVGFFNYGIVESRNLFDQVNLPPELNDLTFTYIVKYIKPVDGKDFCEVMKDHSNRYSKHGIASCQPNYLLTIADSKNNTGDPFLNSEGSWGQTYPDLWAMNKIEANQARNKAQGEGVTVAVIDTGVDYLHPDIKNNIWTNPGEVINGVDDDGNGLIDDLNGYDFSTCNEYGALADINDAGCLRSKRKDNDPMDFNGHGTHVAGVIAAEGDNGQGIIGVAPQAKIMPIKSFNSQGIADSASVAQGIVYAALNGANVINNSWVGREAVNPIIEMAVDRAHKLGAVVVQSAGNDFGKDVREITPQRIPETITVGATGFNDEPVPFSNTGSKVDVYAPGLEILSLNARGGENSISKYFEDQLAVDPDKVQFDRMVPDKDGKANYLRLNGTSMAAAHVAGLSALLLSENPSLTNEDIRAILVSSADKNALGDSNNRRINALDALSTDMSMIDYVQIFDDESDPFDSSSYEHRVVEIDRRFLEGTGVGINDMDYFDWIVFTPFSFDESFVHSTDLKHLKPHLGSVVFKNKDDAGLDVIMDLGEKLDFESDNETLYIYSVTIDAWEDFFGIFLSKVNGYDYESTMHIVDEHNTDTFASPYGEEDAHDEGAKARDSFLSTDDPSDNTPTNMHRIELDEVAFSDGSIQGEIVLTEEELENMDISDLNQLEKIDIIDLLEQLPFSFTDAEAMEINGELLQRIVVDEKSIPQLLSPKVGEPIAQPDAQFRWTSGDENYEYYLLVGTCKDLNPCMGNIYQRHIGQDLSAVVPFVPLNGEDVYVKLAYRLAGQEGPWEFDVYAYSTLNEEEEVFLNNAVSSPFPLTYPDLFSEDVSVDSASNPLLKIPITQENLFLLKRGIFSLFSDMKNSSDKVTSAITYLSSHK